MYKCLSGGGKEMIAIFTFRCSRGRKDTIYFFCKHLGDNFGSLLKGWRNKDYSISLQLHKEMSKVDKIVVEINGKSPNTSIHFTNTGYGVICEKDATLLLSTHGELKLYLANYPAASKL